MLLATPNVGTTCGWLTVIVNEVSVAHWFGSAVNWYVTVCVLSIVGGFHVPVIPFTDVNGNAGTVWPKQNGPIGSNAGDSIGFSNTRTSVEFIVQLFTVKLKLAYSGS